MDAMVGPDGRPSTFDGAAWISQDGKYWWNGAAWQPVKRRGAFQPPIALAVIIVAVLVGAWFLFTRVIPPDTKPPVVMGVTNAKIVSSTQIEFDYARSTRCGELNFQIVFYDKSGRSVGDYVSEYVNGASPGVEHHYVFKTKDTIPSSAVRFVATPACNG